MRARLSGEMTGPMSTPLSSPYPIFRLAAASLPGHLGEFADDMDATVHPRLFSMQEASTVIEAFDKGIQSILIGEATPEQVAAQVEEVKQHEERRKAQSFDSRSRARSLARQSRSPGRAGFRLTASAREASDTASGHHTL